MHKTIKNIIFCTAITCSKLSFAGGPLVIEGQDGNTPVTYADPNITLHVENGKLGTRSNTEADELLQQALNLWNTVNTATINLTKNETELDFDINLDNYTIFLPDPGVTGFFIPNDSNPVVYDDTGEIIDAFFGNNQSDSTIGFATSIVFAGEDHFIEGYAVINGKDLGLSNTTFKLLIAHEIGHLLGMDHSQVDINNEERGFTFCNASDLRRYPVMYPFACRDDPSLHSDDISAISALYPDASVDSNYGILSGFITDKFGNAVLGANIWAKHNDGRTFSIVSDYLKQATGFYELLLPPGNYELHANTINTAFNDGSSIGPYALTPDSESFSCLEPFSDTRYEGDTPGSVEIITISTNQTTTTNFKLTDVDVSGCPDQPTQLPAKSSAKSTGKGSFETSPETLWLLILLLISHRIKSRQTSRNTSRNLI
jgi:hypothetical protein